MVMKINEQKIIKKNKNDEITILILNRKGGRTSARIIDEIIKRPLNINQLANMLGISYNTVHYHIRIMKGYKLVEKKTTGYGSVYVVTSKLLKNIEYYNQLKKLL